MFKKIRFYYLLASAFLRKNFRLLARWSIIVLFVFVFFLLTFSGFWEPIFTKFTQNLFKSTYTEGLVGSVKALNPLFETSQAEREINHILFRGLTKVSQDGTIEPDLAESYEIKNNNLDYIFHLRHGLYWDDGRAFSADDVVYTVETSQNSALNTTAKNIFKDVKVSKLDDFTVQFELKEAFAPFLTQTDLGILPKHIPLQNYRPVGMGSFHLTSFSHDKIVLSNNNLDLVFRLYSSEDQALTALKLGEIKALGNLSNDELAQFANWPNYNLYTKTLPRRLVAVFFNTRADVVSDQSVRQALSFAVDKDSLLKLADKGALEASGPLPETNYLKLSSEERYKFDTEHAASLLDASGWKLQNGARKKDNTPLTLTITTSAEGQFPKIAEQIAQTWSSLGIKVQTIMLNNNDLDDVVRRTQFQVVLTTEEISSDPDQYVLWHSTQINQGNFTAFSSQKVDKLLEDARKTLDPAVRADKYNEFTRILDDEAPAVFLFYPGYNWLVNKKISGINLDDFAIPADRFNSAKNWKIPKI